MTKLKTIIMSRFKKQEKSDWLNYRREICKSCPLNTKNMQRLPFKVRILKSLSDFYTRITRAENEDLGECSDCGCNLYFKTLEPELECPKNKWKSIN